MNSLWYLFESELSESQCNEINDLWSDIDSHKGKIGDQTKYKNVTIRNSDINAFPYSSSEQKAFQEILNPYITVANRDCFGFNLNGFCEFQIAQYKPNNFYSEHLDVQLNENESQRKLSLTLQLTDPKEYEGGDFIFGSGINQPSNDALRKKGSILIFPSFLPHTITEVKEGVRRSLVGWYEGKKWS